ncbi:MAG: tetratricopeptide repeat-containing sensor histidine kinase [Bacteroidales bacterium]|nr:tetratricopeptide repeat-containing sensor histidine kinase [Bacteroidales bacterium]
MRTIMARQFLGISIIIFLSLIFNLTCIAQSNETIDQKISRFLDKAKEVSRTDVEKYQAYRDSASHLINKTKNSEILVRYFNMRGAVLLEHGNYDSAYFYFKKGLPFIPNATEQLQIVNLYHNLAICYIKMDSLEKAHSIFNLLITKNAALKDTHSLAKLYLDMALLYKKQNILDSALFYLEESQILFLRLKDTIGIMINLNGKAILLADMGFFDEAVATMRKAWGFDTLYDGYNMLGTVYLNLGDMYSRRLKMNDSAEYFLQLCIEEGKRSNIPYMIEAARVNLSNVYFNDRKFEEIVQLLKPNLQSTFHDVLISSWINTGVALKELNRDSAKFYLTEGIKLAKSYNFLFFQKVGYEHLYQFDSLRGNFREAFINLKQFELIKDSINSLSNVEALNQLKVNFQLEKKQQETEFWKRETETAKVSLRRKTMINNLMIVVSLALIGLLSLIIIMSFKTKKYNNQLHQFNLELTHKNDLLNDINKIKNNLLSILSHDLKAYISPSNQLLHYLNENFDDIDEEEKRTLILSITKSSDTINNLMTNLLDWIKIQYNKDTHQLNATNLKESIDLSLETIQATHQEINQLIIKNLISPETTVCSDQNVLRTIFRNLISNAVKYTPIGGSITIDGVEVDGLFALKITDSGMGIAPENLDKIFDYSFNHSTLGIHKEKGSGFGLKVVKEMVKITKGKIEVESRLGSGTTFTVYFPLCRNN